VGVTVEMLVSSRNDSDIYDHFGKGSNFYIDASDDVKDIQPYIKHKLQNLLLSRKAKRDIREQVRGGA